MSAVVVPDSYQAPSSTRSPCGHNGAKKDINCLDHKVYQDRCSRCCVECNGNSQQEKPVEVTKSLVQRDAHGRILKGTPNPGGRTKKFREIEIMLNKEHRNIDNMREVFQRLRALAMGEVILVPVVTADGRMELTCKLQADSRFMQLYLNRVLGPEKAHDDEIDFSDAPKELIDYLRSKVA